MFAGCGRAGDFAGDPLICLDSHVLAWLDAGATQITASWTGVAALPVDAEWYTYRNGYVIQRGATSPHIFDAIIAGALPNLAVVPVAAGVGDSNYDPLGAQSLANLTGLRQRYLHQLRGRYRMAQDALAQYELFQGVDENPDFTAAPYETFASLPHTTAALAAGHTYAFVLRKRNQFNLSSQNVAAWILVVNASGNESQRPSAPSVQLIGQAVGGRARITANYDYLVDLEAVRATTWSVWLTSNGTDPDPENDTPVYTGAMQFVDGQAKLDYTSAACSHGATLKAIVRTRRAGPPVVDSANTTIMSITADAVGPAAPVQQTFLGESARQG
jgi:hypothetical protein